MRGKDFTPEEIRILSGNPNTYKVSKCQISFTKEGKEKILEMYDSGIPTRTILSELGYDPDMLGVSRYKNFVWHIRQEAESERGIHQGSSKRTRMTSIQIANLEESNDSYAKLKNEVIYLREEVEFLKKSHSR